jgi:hypothetical protein
MRYGQSMIGFSCSPQLNSPQPALEMLYKYRPEPKPSAASRKLCAMSPFMDREGSL